MATEGQAGEPPICQQRLRLTAGALQGDGPVLHGTSPADGGSHQQRGPQSCLAGEPGGKLPLVIESEPGQGQPILPLLQGRDQQRGPLGQGCGSLPEGHRLKALLVLPGGLQHGHPPGGVAGPGKDLGQILRPHHPQLGLGALPLVPEGVAEDLLQLSGAGLGQEHMLHMGAAYRLLPGPGQRLNGCGGGGTLALVHGGGFSLPALCSSVDGDPPVGGSHPQNAHHGSASGLLALGQVPAAGEQEGRCQSQHHQPPHPCRLLFRGCRALSRNFTQGRGQRITPWPCARSRPEAAKGVR